MMDERIVTLQYTSSSNIENSDLSQQNPRSLARCYMFSGVCFMAMNASLFLLCEFVYTAKLLLVISV